MTLHRYWFHFTEGAGIKLPAGVRLGCGVTAYDYDDATRILEERIFRGQPVAEIADYVEDIDVSTLDPGHVLPNMRSPHERGVWFPQGYD